MSQKMMEILVILLESYIVKYVVVTRLRVCSQSVAKIFCWFIAEFSKQIIQPNFVNTL